MKLQRFKLSPSVQFTLTIIILTTLFALLSNNPAMVDAGVVNVKSCNIHCSTKFNQAQKNKNCAECCMKTSQDDKSTGKCVFYRRCMCNIPSTLTRKFHISVPKMLQGPLCLNAINTVRRKSGLKPLKFNSKLQAASKIQWEWATKNNCFGNDCPGEPSASEFVAKVGYEAKDGFHIGDVATEDKNTNCKTFVGLWLKDNEMRPAVLGNDYTEIGCYAGKCRNCKWYWYNSCLFGLPKQSPNNNRSLRKGFVPTRGINKYRNVSKRSPPTFRRN